MTEADLGKTIQVRVTFTDDAENEESLTSAATEAVAAKATRACPPSPGRPRWDETLTADTSAIEDEDGLENVSYEYQWMADDTDIAGATDSTYTLTEADQGKTIQVRVTFTDDAENEESLTSAATEAVAAKATGLPAISGTPQVGETLTADIVGHYRRGWAGKRRLQLPVDGRRVGHRRSHRLQLRAHQ